MRTGKLLLLFAIIAALAVLPAKGFAQETLVYGTTEKVIDMDPANAYDFHTWEIFYNIYQGLLKYPPGKTNLVPGLAESYDISSDGKEYTFKL
jgi:peptide/nickel transport system substrate-binding protein